LNLAIYPIGLLLGLALFMWAYFYKRRHKHTLKTPELLVLIVTSYITSAGVILFLRGIDYAVNKWWGIGPFLSGNSNDVLETTVLGSMLGILIVIFGFWQYFRRD
jgi:hypothetical protein